MDLTGIMGGVTGRMKLDVVICTKDRPEQLKRSVAMCNQLLPYRRLYVYDGTVNKDEELLQYLTDKYGVYVVDVKGLTFGAVRNLAMKATDADYVAMIDDDITLTWSWLSGVMKKFEDPKVAASQGRLIYGSGNNLIRKLSENARRDDGGSGGASIYDRKKILEVGNFNKNVHRGEDLELKLRLQAKGYKWAKNVEVRAYHPVTSYRAWLDRPRADAVGYEFIMRNTGHRTRFMFERFGSFLVMPIYYLWTTRDPRCSALWLAYRFLGIYHYLRGNFAKWG